MGEKGQGMEIRMMSKPIVQKMAIALNFCLLSGLRLAIPDPIEIRATAINIIRLCSIPKNRTDLSPTASLKLLRK